MRPRGPHASSRHCEGTRQGEIRGGIYDPRQSSSALGGVQSRLAPRFRSENPTAARAGGGGLMSAWEERSRDAARLFNPAFLATIMAAAAADYERSSNEPMPWLLSFAIPPLALTESTRHAMPASIRAHFANWLDEHP